MNGEPVIYMGWKEIGRALGRTAKTAKRLARHHGMPIVYLGQTPTITRKALENWWFIKFRDQKSPPPLDPPVD